MKSFLKKSALCSASCLQALSVTGLAVGAIAISAPAVAQDYTAGAVTGTVLDEAGAPVAGATVTLTSSDQGFSRTTTTTDSGNFRFGSLTPGNYDLRVTSPGAADFTATGVRVVASDIAALNVVLPTAGGDEIVVTAAQIQVPFSGTTSGINVDLEELAQRVPISRNITDVILLAPGTSRGESIFGGRASNLASINGSSVAENAYYINGLNITNFDNYLGGVQVPFEFYKSVEVKSGGYSAEFGRATGGIVNAVSKSGSNEFQAAVHLNYAPNMLRESSKDLYTCSYNDPDDVAAGRTCSTYTNRRNDVARSYSAIAEAGGPVIKDRLFVYGLVEMRKNETLVNDTSSNLAYHRESDSPFWAVKVDALPLDNHRLEFTIFDTRDTVTQRNLAYSESANGEVSYGLADTIFEENSGGINYVGKYTGNFTDWLTLSAAYGRMRDRFDLVGVSGGAGDPFFQNASGVPINGVPHGGLMNGQSESIADFPYRIEREFYRADADLFFTAFGDHHVRFGYDRENNNLVHTAVGPGNGPLCTSGFLSEAACTAGFGGAGARLLLRPNSVVEVNYYNTGGSFDATNQAFYIQDEWQPFDRLTLNLGLRRDDFKLFKTDGSILVDLKDNYAPRLGAEYEIWPDRSGKLKAFWGQYYLPVASNTAFRQASEELYFRERFNYDGFDSNGLPNLGAQVTNLAAYQGDCPFGLTPQSSGDNCAITGIGEVPDTLAAISHNLKATKETEWIIGYEHQFGGWLAGVNYSHRNLDVNAEDMAIDKAVLAYCDAEGVTGCEDIWTGFHQYVVGNPGSDFVIQLADAIGGEAAPRTVTFTAAELAAIGYPKAERTYDAVEFSLRHPWNGQWTLEAYYTWSESKGNSEGFVSSDFQQDDSGITQDFDQPGFLEGAYGLLPNHRRHRLKLWGAYALSDAFLVGTNVSVESPRKLSCIGYHPGSDITDGSFENVYGAASHYCSGVLSPRATAQQSDWNANIDMSFRYNIEVPTGQLVTFRADIFNIMNSSAVEDRNEIGDLDLGEPSASYGLPRVYQSPRSVRLGVDIAF